MKSFFLLLFAAILTVNSFGQSSFVPVRYNTTARASVSGPLSPAAVRELERDAFQLTNTERTRAGLPALKWSDKIAQVARLHSSNMADYNFFSHKGLDGLMVDERADMLNMGRWLAIGENIAFMKGYENPVAVAVDRWLKSPRHKENLLSPNWTEAAIGLAVTPDGKYYFTQVFIKN